MANSNEIRELVDSMMEDGELSEAEVLDLAGWLDHNPECRKVWPGKVPVGPVKRMSSGGKVPTMDLRRIALLLGEVQKRRSKDLSSRLLRDDELCGK